MNPGLNYNSQKKYKKELTARGTRDQYTTHEVGEGEGLPSLPKILEVHFFSFLYDKFEYRYNSICLQIDKNPVI